jgi:UPF0042 nucleotide-binding protein
MTEKQRLILVTGPSGAGRSTAIRALEDVGYEVIDNLPLRFVEHLLDVPETEARRPLALGIDARNRDFSVDAVTGVWDHLLARHDLVLTVVYLDCDEATLVRRYSETRRRHPLSPAGSPEAGITREKELLSPLRDRADTLIDTGALNIHELRAEIERRFAFPGDGDLAITVQSFSYKRGLPLGSDLVFDCRFLRNPHWVPDLKPLTGRDAQVAAYVMEDARYAAFFAKTSDLIRHLLPAFRDEGKSHLSVSFGCTGGQHRSVVLAEAMAKSLAEVAQPVSIKHRELTVGATGKGAK